MEDAKFFLTRDLARRRIAVTRANRSDACALPGRYDGLIVEIEAEAQPSNIFRREGGAHCAFFCWPKGHKGPQ